MCFCQGISRQEIVQAIDQGAATLEDIQNNLGATVGPCGGSCTPNVVKLLTETLARKSGAPAAECPPAPAAECPAPCADPPAPTPENPSTVSKPSKAEEA